MANGLDTLNLPRTIEDAIAICKGLKRRYLWVDRFCIQQDSEQDKRQQIDAMASIYSSAEFTIINSSGADMYSPIPGVTEKRNAFQSKVVTGGVEVTNIYPSLGVALKNSTWGKRGWTHQEAILSTLIILATFPTGNSSHIAVGYWLLIS